MENQITSSDYQAYKGLIIRYELQVNDDGQHIHVVGEKAEEIFKGKTNVYKGKARTSFKGIARIFNDNKTPHLKITSDEGSLTKGNLKSEFILQIVSGQLLKGTFSSEAAGTKGLTTLRKTD